MSYHRATEIRAAIERANLVETWEDGQFVGYVPRRALDVARLYAQEAIYSWATGECVSTKDPVGALTYPEGGAERPLQH